MTTNSAKVLEACGAAGVEDHDPEVMQLTLACMLQAVEGSTGTSDLFRVPQSCLQLSYYFCHPFQT